VSMPHHSNPSILRVALCCSRIPAGQSSISLLTTSARQGVPGVVESPKSARAVICRLRDACQIRCLAVELAPAPCGEQAENGKHCKDGSGAQRTLGTPRYAAVSGLRTREARVATGQLWHGLPIGLALGNRSL
jgi:hypothetical protein